MARRSTLRWDPPPGNLIYAAPYGAAGSADRVLQIDTGTGSTALIGNAIAGDNKFRGMIRNPRMEGSLWTVPHTTAASIKVSDPV